MIGHDRGHEHAGGHGHAHGHGANRRATGIAALLTGSFMLVEVVGGVISGSLALLADAGHMLTDFASLALAWYAFRLSERPADPTRTYGFDRVQVLAAFVNGLSLCAIAVWILVEAVDRWREPVEVLAGTMLWIAIAGLLVNLLAAAVLMRGDTDNLNVRGALIHVLGDLLGSVAAIAAAIVILATGWTLADPLLSALVALIIARSGYRVARASAHILLEGVPRGIDTEEIKRTVCREIDGVLAIHHLHVWSITDERPMATLEADVSPGPGADAIRSRIKALLEERFRLDHVTVEMNVVAT